MAFHIAICEDGATERRQLDELCRVILADWNLDADVTAFASADELIAASDGTTEPESTPFDAYLLDIRLPGTSGLDLARRLHADGVRGRVILVTAYAEYALEGYDAHPVHYLLKPISRDGLERALRLVLEARDGGVVSFRNGHRTTALPLGDIRYFESRNHGVDVSLGDRTLFFPQSLGKTSHMLGEESFARCHKSYLVNLAWIEEIGRTGVTLRDGTRLPVSRTFAEGFRRSFSRWLSRHAA